MRRRDDTPLSDRVRAALTGEDPDLIREIEVIERTAAGKYASIAANGRWPHWPLQTWLSVIAAVSGATTAILAFAFTIGGRYDRLTTAVDNHEGRLGRIEQTDQRQDRDIAILRRDVDSQSNNVPRSPRQSESRPWFGSDSHLDMTTGREVR